MHQLATFRSTLNIFSERTDDPLLSDRTVNLILPTASKSNFELFKSLIFTFQGCDLYFFKDLSLYLFECSLDLHPLSPRHRRIGQTVSTVSTPTHVNSLLVKEAESLGHHVNGVVGEGRGVLRTETIKVELWASADVSNRMCSGLGWSLMRKQRLLTFLLISSLKSL